MAELKQGTTASIEDVSEAMDAPIVTTQGNVVDHDPFGDSKRFELEIGSVNLSQLQDEIAESAGCAVAATIIRKEDGTGVLWVSPGDAVDGRKVRGVINHHEPDPDYGLSEAEKGRRTLIDKVRKGTPLEPEEITQALQMLLNAPPAER